MGQTLAIWKWRPAWPFRSDRRVWNRIAEDQAPLPSPVLTPRRSLRSCARFGEHDDAPFTIDVGDFKGHRANWLVLSGSSQTSEGTLTELVSMCTRHGLHIYAT